MNKYEQDYNKKLEILKKLEISTKEKYEKAKEKYENIKNNELIDKKEKRLELAHTNLMRTIHVLNDIKNEKEFLRIGNEEIENEKTWVYHNFESELKKRISSDSTLCFHGCKNIYDVRNIIKSGGLLSSVDRLGYSTSYDSANQVSVTTLKTLGTTIHGYTGLYGEFSLPAGAIFVIKPKDENEIKTSNTSLLIGNVNFIENPERLVAILSTNENKEKISEWVESIGLDNKIVYSFNEILENIDVLEDNDRNVLK